MNLLGIKNIQIRFCDCHRMLSECFLLGKMSSFGERRDKKCFIKGRKEKIVVGVSGGGVSFLLVLLLVAGCVQVVGNQAEAASEPLSEFQPETQAGTEVLLSETELVTETESEITTEAHSEPVSESESVANSENLPETETETIRATEADFQLETEWETETASDLNPETESESEPGTETETEVETQAETESESETFLNRKRSPKLKQKTETESETKNGIRNRYGEAACQFCCFPGKTGLFVSFRNPG